MLGLYLRLGYLDEALRLSDDMLARDPNDVEALKGKIQALTRQPTPAYADALKVCEKLESVAPDDLWGRVQSQILRLQTGVPEDQIVARRRAVARRTTRTRDTRSCPARPTWRWPAPRAATPAGARNGASRRWRTSAPPPSSPRPTPRAVRRLVGLLDFLGQFDRSLDVLQRADDAKVNDAPLRAALVGRLWENGMFKAVIDRTAPVPVSAPMSAATAAPATRTGALPAVATGGFDANVAAQRAWSLYLVGDGPAAQRSGRDRPLSRPAHERPGRVGVGHGAGRRFTRQEQDPREMIKQCQQALSKDPENAAVYAMMGDAYLGLGEQENAAQAWSAAAQKAPTWGLPNALIARVMLAENRADEALQRATAAVRRSPASRVAAEVFVQARFAALGGSPRPRTSRRC